MTADDVIAALELALGFKLLTVLGLIHDRRHHLRTDSAHFQMPEHEKLHDSVFVFEFIFVVIFVPSRRQFIGKRFAHSREKFHRRFRLILLHLGDGKADVDEHPVAGSETFFVAPCRC